MKLIIKRDEWLRGEGGSRSYLLRSTDNKKCCIGFFGQQLGVANRCLLNTTLPRVKNGIWPEWLFDSKNSHVSDLVQANDSILIDELNREAKITALFAECDVQVEFVD